MRRRRCLASLAAGTALLAGCTGSSAPTESPTPADYLGRFERNLRTIENPNLSQSGGVVTLTYSVSEPTEKLIREQIETVAVAFAQVVGAGWDVDRIEVVISSGGRTIVTYHIEAEWARKFNRGAFLPDEYGSHIDATVETATPTSS